MAQPRPPQFPLAGQPDVVRSHQKDEYYANGMFDQVRELCQWFMGSRRVLRLEAELKMMSDLVYYILTTLLNQPTLGEEYCDIVQVVGDPQRTPSFMRRGTLITFRTVFPYLFNKGLLYHLRQSNNEETPETVEKIRNASLFLFRFNLAIFYMTGMYLELSKRFTGVKYIFTGKTDQPRPNYKILGIFIIFQQMVSLIMYTRSTLESHRSKQEQAELIKSLIQEEIVLDVPDTPLEVDDGRYRCGICLERRKHTTATICGHLFCWKCITECCAANPQASKCPSCRQPITLQGLARVYHYDRQFS